MVSPFGVRDLLYSVRFVEDLLFCQLAVISEGELAVVVEAEEFRVFVESKPFSVDQDIRLSVGLMGVGAEKRYFAFPGA